MPEKQRLKDREASICVERGLQRIGFLCCSTHPVDKWQLHISSHLEAVLAECKGGFVMPLDVMKSETSYRVTKDGWQEVSAGGVIESGKLSQFHVWYDKDAAFLDELDRRIDTMAGILAAH